jgi:flagellar motor component MotA
MLAFVFAALATVAAAAAAVGVFAAVVGAVILLLLIKDAPETIAEMAASPLLSGSF